MRGGLFAGVHGEGLYFSGDGGKSWQPRMTGLDVKHVFTVASAARRGQPVIYAGTEPAHLFVSYDYGESWTELPGLRQVPDTDRWSFPAPPHTGHLKAMAFDPTNDLVMYAAIEQGALLKSADGGETWTELTAYSRPDDHAYKDVHRVVVGRSNPRDLYMPSGIGLYISHDGGDQWDRITDRGSRIGYPDQFLISPLDEQVMFMAGSATSPGTWRTSHHADATVMRSDDGGQTWREAARGLPANMRGNIEAMSLARYNNRLELFAATTAGEVFVSDDQAESWSLCVSGLAPVSKVGHYQHLQEPAA